MRQPRIYLDQPIRAGSQILLPSGAAQHALGVLRLAPGARLTLFNGDGCDYQGRLLDGDRRKARVAVDNAGDPEPIPSLAVRLGIGISKGERFDLAIQKAVELGVSEVQPLFTERTVVRLAGERLAKREQHWWGVVIAACEQSGRRRLPQLAPATRMSDWLPQGQPAGLLLDPAADRSLADLPEPSGTVTLLVGPEGGLSEVERTAAHHSGFMGVRLGPRILRTETAPLAAIAAIQTLWGDFR
jgi:16S rRNA (uracil1498-N3)-methyltransferase